jgi:D-alanyl-lipoteichoic acid acyltransferase DltB (MBOAT superfamily)
MYNLAAIFPIIVVLINFLICRFFKGSKWNTVLTWTINLIILFSSKYYRGYRFEEILGKNYAMLDSYRGVTRWETYFNVMFCRLISFNMDYRDSILDKGGKEQSKPEWDEYRTRTSTQLDSSRDYGFISYLSYVFYVPLLIAGPVMSYNAFYSYVTHRPQQEVSLAWYTARVFIYAILLDASLHFFFTNGFNNMRFWKKGENSPFGNPQITDQLYTFTPAETAATGVLTVVYMYVKFYVIWRFFRMWALWDGVNPPEVSII